MTLKIEEGKYYRNRRGDRVGPMVWQGIASWTYPWKCPSTKRTFTRTGMVFYGRDDLMDLVVEWVDEPTFTMDQFWKAVEGLRNAVGPEIADRYATVIAQGLVAPAPQPEPVVVDKWAMVKKFAEGGWKKGEIYPRVWDTLEEANQARLGQALGPNAWTVVRIRGTEGEG